MMSSNRLKNYKIGTALLLIFLLPMLASWFLYNNPHYFKLKTTNHGVLIQPVIQIKQTAYENNGPKTWRIIYIPDQTCGAECESIFSSLKQVKKALGKHSERVLVKTSVPESLFPSAVSQDFIEKKFVMNNKIYLIDPMDNLFMYYPDTINPMDVLKDLKKVLEVSQIG